MPLVNRRRLVKNPNPTGRSESNLRASFIKILVVFRLLYYEMNDNDYACMLQFFTERNLFYPAGAQWVSKTIMNPGRDPHSNSVLLPVRFRPAGHLQISGSDTFTT